VDKVLETADRILAQMAERKAALEALEKEAEAEIQAVRAAYASRIRREREWLQGLEGSLIRLMKAQRKVIFGERDKVSLPHGALLHGWEQRTRIPRDALAKIEAAGWTEAIRIVKSLDRAVIEGWPVERLAAIGAERKAVEVYKYEISGG